MKLEQVIQVAVLLVAGAGAHYQAREQLTRVEGKLNALTSVLVEKGVLKAAPITTSLPTTAEPRLTPRTRDRVQRPAECASPTRRTDARLIVARRQVHLHDAIPSLAGDSQDAAEAERGSRGLCF